MDDPLWVVETLRYNLAMEVLIPLLVDDPLWAPLETFDELKKAEVLIPLLVDDPLWGVGAQYER